MSRGQPSIPHGPIGVGLSSLMNWKYRVLLMLALIGVVVPLLPGRPPPVQENGDRVKVDRKALDDFLEAYRLAPGQILKRVAPPRLEGVRTWWKQKNPMDRNRPDQFGTLVFRWRDPDQLDYLGGSTGGGASLRELLRHVAPEIYESEIDGNRELLDTILTGDWVYRDGVAVERRVHELEVIIQSMLSPRISLTFRRVERDVVVARGSYQHTPLEGRPPDVIEIYGAQVVPGGGGAGGGSGDFAKFLKRVGDWIGRPVVSEVEPPPKGPITWFYNRRKPSTEETRREDRDEGLVLRHLQEQTGLTFSRVRRPIRILFIERAK
jgi:hypothetical protein